VKPTRLLLRVALQNLTNDLVDAIMVAIRESLPVGRVASPRGHAEPARRAAPASPPRPSREAAPREGRGRAQAGAGGSAGARSGRKGRARRADNQLELFSGGAVEPTVIVDPEALLGHASAAPSSAKASRPSEPPAILSDSARPRDGARGRARGARDRSRDGRGREEPEKSEAPEQEDSAARFVARPGEEVLKARGGGLVLRRRAPAPQPGAVKADAEPPTE